MVIVYQRLNAKGLRMRIWFWHFHCPHGCIMMILKIIGWKDIKDYGDDDKPKKIYNAWNFLGEIKVHQ
jgi:hypothetical protein